MDYAKHDSPTRALARHTLSCLPCNIKATRLLKSPAHLERQELLCAIEYCAHRRAGRKLHS